MFDWSSSPQHIIIGGTTVVKHSHTGKAMYYLEKFPFKFYISFVHNAGEVTRYAIQGQALHLTLEGAGLLLYSSYCPVTEETLEGSIHAAALELEEVARGHIKNLLSWSKEWEKLMRNQ
jgi:hypothetical protein